MCHFIGEYTARKGLLYSATNRLILDFKMPVQHAGSPAWRLKEAAIATAAAVLRGAVHPSVLDELVFVPMPPSKAKDDPGYDDRLVRMLGAVRPGRPLDMRELILQSRSAAPSHMRPARGQASDIADCYRIDETLPAPAPGVVAVVDDLLTSVAHFRPGKRVLTRRFADIDMVGLFLARRVPQTALPQAAGEIRAARESPGHRRAPRPPVPALVPRPAALSGDSQPYPASILPRAIEEAYPSLAHDGCRPRRPTERPRPQPRAAPPKPPPASALRRHSAALEFDFCTRSRLPRPEERRALERREAQERRRHQRHGLLGRRAERQLRGGPPELVRPQGRRRRTTRPLA